MTEYTETLRESRIREAMPSGFETTMVDTSRLRDLYNTDLDLDSTVEDYAGYEMTEEDVIETEVQRVITSYLLPERTVEIPGVGMELERLKQFASWFKKSDDTPTGTITDVRRASADDLIFTFATPQVYNQIAELEDGDPEFVNNFNIEGVEEGDEINIIGEDGFNSSGDGVMNLSDNEMLYFTGDFIDLSEGKSIFTAMEWKDIDGDTSYGPWDFMFDGRLSGFNLNLGQAAWLKRQGRAVLKAYEDGDAEIVPIAFYMGPGHKKPDL